MTKATLVRNSSGNRVITKRSGRPLWTGSVLALAALAAGGVVAVGAARFPIIDATVVPLTTALLLLVGLCRLLRPDDTVAARRILGLCLAAFVGHLLIGSFINQSHTLVQNLGGDAVTYDAGAQVIVAHWHDATTALPAMGAGKEGFYYALAGLYWVFGSHATAGLVLNAFFGAALVPLMADLTGRLFGADAGWKAGLIVTLQPGFLIWTSQLLREAGVIFMIAVALNCVVRLAARPQVAQGLILAVDLVLLLTFRANVAVVVAAGLAAGLLMSRKRVGGAILTTVAILGLVIVFVGALGVGRAGFNVSSSASLQQVSQARSDLSTSAASGFDPTADVSTPARAVSYLPIGLPSFLLGPFPWQVHNARELLGWLEALTVLALVPSIRRGWRRSRHAIEGRRMLLLVPAIALAIALTLLIGNYGTVVRERLQVLIFLVPLAGLGLSPVNLRQTVVRSV